MKTKSKWIDPLTAAERAEWNRLEKEGRFDGRIAFSMRYYTDEKDAERFGELSSKMGNTYNGGWFHGMSCGREKQFDHEIDGVKWFAASY